MYPKTWNVREPTWAVNTLKLPISLHYDIQSLHPAFPTSLSTKHPNFLLEKHYFLACVVLVITVPVIWWVLKHLLN